VISMVQAELARQFPANSCCANSVRDHECHARLLKTIVSILGPLSFGLREVVVHALLVETASGAGGSSSVSAGRTTPQPDGAPFHGWSRKNV